VAGKSAKAEFKKDTMRMKVKRYIMNGITSGEYKPGERLVETRIAKELNVSQAPVREALLELSIMGMLEERAYSGTFVRMLDVDDIEDIYDTRAYMEERAATKAAMFRTQEDLDRMEEVLDQMDVCDDFDEIMELDHAFHTAMIAASKSKSLERVRDILQIREWTYETGIAIGSSLESIRTSHRQLYDYIRDQDPHLAGACAYEHIKGFGRQLLRVIKARQEETALDA